MLTHIHYDHVGNFQRLPNTQFHLQEVELHHTTGRHMRHPFLDHSPGMQFGRVHTSRGWVVLASDVTHYYENMERGPPFTAACNIGDMLQAYDALRAMRRIRATHHSGPRPSRHAPYPRARGELEGVVARFDVMPRE